jgi:hypothetical protein
MLDTKYLYIHDKQRSREYELARYCVGNGVEVLERPWASVSYRVGVAGESKGMPRDFSGAKKRAKELLVKRPSGVTVVVERLIGGDPADQVRFRKVTVKPPVAKTEGVLGIDRIVGWVNAEARAGRLHGVRYAGICVCKPDSDHRDCAAVDIFADMDSMEKIEREFWSQPEWYNAKYSILRDQIRFFGHAEHYTGVYHLHNHLSVNGGIPGSAC